MDNEAFYFILYLNKCFSDSTATPCIKNIEFPDTVSHQILFQLKKLNEAELFIWVWQQVKLHFASYSCSQNKKIV